MTTKNLFFPFVMTVLLTTVIIEVSFSQVNIKTVGIYEYAQFDGVWYTVVEGKQGDLVDTKHLLVRLRDKGNIDGFNFSALSLPHLKNVRGEFADGFYELEIPSGLEAFDVSKTLDQSRAFDEVLFNVFFKLDANPNDQHFSGQWNLPKVIMPAGWDITTGSSQIIVAVIDVGGDYDHEDLAGNRWSGIGYDFYDNDTDPYPSDGAGHGTAVAGILGAVTNNSIGVAGVAGGWGGVGGIRIMHLDAGYRDAQGDEWIGISAAAQATGYAAAQGARVINMSFGGSSSLPTLESAINSAVNNYGVVVVASAGNYQSGQSTSVLYPARYSNVVAVGATTPSDSRKELNDGTEWWWGSSYGPELDVMAPGVYVWTTDLTGSIGYSAGNYYDSFNGTSAAAPHVAGLAALIRSIDPTLTWQEVRDIIRSNADDKGLPGFDNEYGYGRINALRALGTMFALNNPGYEFVYGSVPLSFHSTTNMQFFPGPNWCNAQGAYHNTERHRLLIEVNRSFTQIPTAWYLGPIGYSWANPNGSTSWLSQTITTNTIRFETVFYKLTVGNLTCENGWAPFNPNPIEKSYAYLGIPTAPAVNPPTSLSGSPYSSSETRLTWHDNSNNEVGFKIERGTNGVDFEEVGELLTGGSGTGTRTYTDGGLSQNVTYHYRIRVFAQAYMSPPSNTVQVTIPLLSAPTNVMATTELPYRVQLSWNSVSGAQAYRVYRATALGGPFMQVADIPATSHLDQVPSAPMTYYYYVRARAGEYEGPQSATQSASTYHLASSSTGALSISSQRKILRDHNGNYHAVYSSAGHVWYTYSYDGSTWAPEQHVCDDIYGPINRYPTLTFLDLTPICRQGEKPVSSVKGELEWSKTQLVEKKERDVKATARNSNLMPCGCSWNRVGALHRSPET